MLEDPGKLSLEGGGDTGPGLDSLGWEGWAERRQMPGEKWLLLALPILLPTVTPPPPTKGLEPACESGGQLSPHSDQD